LKSARKYYIILAVSSISRADLAYLLLIVQVAELTQ